MSKPREIENLSPENPDSLLTDLRCLSTEKDEIYDWQSIIEHENLLYPIINFDESSRCWTNNKIKQKNGMYKYQKEKRNLFRRGLKDGT